MSPFINIEEKIFRKVKLIAFFRMVVFGTSVGNFKILNTGFFRRLFVWIVRVIAFILTMVFPLIVTASTVGIKGKCEQTTMQHFGAFVIAFLSLLIWCMFWIILLEHSYRKMIDKLKLFHPDLIPEMLIYENYHEYSEDDNDEYYLDESDDDYK